MTVKFDERGLICAIAQDYASGDVLMQAYMNEEALDKTLKTGYAHYYSRSRQCLWKKGETSGHVQKVVSCTFDCDNDCLLMQVEQTGAACHTGRRSCFFQTVKEDDGAGIRFLAELELIVHDRKNNPEDGSYTTYLLEKGVDKIAKKDGEEGTKELISESADLLYHLAVLFAAKGVSFAEVCSELKSRHKA